MNKQALIVTVLAALVGGCASALPPIQTESSDYSAPRCESKETEKERGDCYRERSKLAEQLLEAGATKSESHGAASASSPGAQPFFLPGADPTPVVGMQYSVRYEPDAGNAQNGCGGPMGLVLINNTEALIELAGDGLQRCGNGASLVPIIAEAPNGGVRIAFVTPPGKRSMYYHTKRNTRKHANVVTAIAYAAMPYAGGLPPDVAAFAALSGGALPSGTSVPQPGFVKIAGRVLPTVPTMGHPYDSSGEFPSGDNGRVLDVRDSHFGI